MDGIDLFQLYGYKKWIDEGVDARELFKL